MGGKIEKQNKYSVESPIQW